MQDIHKKYDVTAPQPPGAETSLSAEEHMSVIKAEQQSCIIASGQTVGATIAILSLSQTLGIATAVTDGPHGLYDDYWADIRGVDQWQYRGVQQITVVDETTFTFDVPGDTPSPATGSMTIYVPQLDKALSMYSQCAMLYYQEPPSLPFDDNYLAIRFPDSEMPPPTEFRDGMTIFFRPAIRNVSFYPTIQIEGMAPKPIQVEGSFRIGMISPYHSYLLTYISSLDVDGAFVMAIPMINGEAEEVSGVKTFRNGINLGTGPYGYDITDIAYSSTGTDDDDHVMVTKAYIEEATFESDTMMWFYQDTAPTGWTTEAISDSLIAIKGGAQDYNVAGGNTAGVWQQDGHTLVVAEMPAHTHTKEFFQDADEFGVQNHDFPGGASLDPPLDRYRTMTTDSTGGDGSHDHGDTWRPAAAVGIVCSKD